MSTGTLDVSKEAHACNHNYVYIYRDPRTAHALGQFYFCNISGSDGQFSYVFSLLQPEIIKAHIENKIHK